MFADAGHEIQNHSDVHPHVKGMNVNDLITDTKSASRKIKDITDTEPTLYRAPYGEYDDTVITTVEGMGLTVIQWDVDSLDWKKPDPSAITKKVVNSVKSGQKPVKWVQRQSSPHPRRPRRWSTWPWPDGKRGTC